MWWADLMSSGTKASRRNKPTNWRSVLFVRQCQKSICEVTPWTPGSAMSDVIASTLLGRMSAYCPRRPWRTQRDSEPYAIYMEAGALPNTIILIQIWCSPLHGYERPSRWRLIATGNDWKQSNAYGGQSSRTVPYHFHPPEIGEARAPYMLY